MAINKKPRNSLDRMSMTSIPIANQNKANPIILLIPAPKKTYITNNICLFLFKMLFYHLFPGDRIR